MGFAVGGAIVGSALLGYESSQNAADAQESAANTASNTQMQMFNRQQQNEQPYLQAGYGALGQLQQQMPDLTKQFSVSDYQQSPGYQFQLQQGTQAIQNSQAAKGALNSGATLKALQSYGQGLANQDYQQAYNNFTQSQQQRYNMLAGVAGAGQNGLSQINSAGQNAANNVSQNQMAAGNAQAAGYVGGANAISGGVSNGANMWMNYQMMNKMFPSSAAPAGSSGGGYGGGTGYLGNYNLEG